MARMLGIVLVLLAWAGTAAADDLPIESFYGSFEGRTVGFVEAGEVLRLQPRALSVAIAPSAAGFRIEWTTVFLDPAGGPEALRTRQAGLDFVATDTPGFYRGRDTGDPLRGQTVTWAQVRANTLHVRQMHLDPDGRYHVLDYARTLEDGMLDLRFTRITEGRTVREVRGMLRPVS